jgi:hypothetical protein
LAVEVLVDEILTQQLMREFDGRSVIDLLGAVKNLVCCMFVGFTEQQIQKEAFVQWQVLGEPAQEAGRRNTRSS